MAKLMSYKSTGLGGASKSIKRTSRKVDRFRKHKEKEIVIGKKRTARAKIKSKGKAVKSEPVYEAKQHTTYSASGAKIEAMKLTRQGLNVKTVKTGSGIFTEYKVFTDKPLPKEKYWD